MNAVAIEILPTTKLPKSIELYVHHNNTNVIQRILSSGFDGSFITFGWKEMFQRKRPLVLHLGLGFRSSNLAKLFQGLVLSIEGKASGDLTDWY